MSLNLTILKYLGLFFFFLLMLSCGSEEKKTDLNLQIDNSDSVDLILNINSCSLFYKSQDVSIVNISSLENLENCAGIRGFKFGDRVSKFGDCIKYVGEYDRYKLFHCDYIDFFEKEMSLSIIFKDSLLIGYSLGSYLQSNDGVCGVLKKFVNIYGSPNVFSNKFIRGNLIDSDEYLRFKNERFAKSYYESYNDAINSFNCDYHELSSVDSFLDQSQGNNFQVWLSPDDRETNDFGFFKNKQRKFNFIKIL